MFDRIENIKNISVMVFGDIMVDKYVNGTVKRISPEAPVPVLSVKEKYAKLGGAGNVIDNIISLGGNACAVGFLGNDTDGCWAKKALVEKNVNTDYVLQYDECQTTTKTRITSKGQQFIRIDEEQIHPIPDKYLTFLKTNANKLLDKIQVVVISDYGKGAVTLESAQLIIKEAKKRGIPVIVDPKGKDYTKYSGATVCTPNMNEIRIVSGELIESENELLEVGNKLRRELLLEYLAVTRSEKGITLFEDGKTFNYPAISKDVADVSGAGDTVVATMACLLGCGVHMQQCCQLANIAASIVCSKFGTATLTLNELMEHIVTSRYFKYVSVQNAKYIINSLREKGKKIVFTNGCFDLLHAGHISSFAQAKEFGDVLFVAVNSDESVKRLKGKNRPIINEENRIKMLCSVEMVDFVVLMEEDNPISIISQLKPDVTVKGKDWNNKILPERDLVESYGGEVRFIEMEGALSTTRIIERIRDE